MTCHRDPYDDPWNQERDEDETEDPRMTVHDALVGSDGLCELCGEDPSHEIHPHDFQADSDRPDVCYVCGLIGSDHLLPNHPEDGIPSQEDLCPTRP